MADRKCRMCQEPGPKCACVRTGRAGHPAYTVDDEVLRIICTLRGNIKEVERWMRHTDHVIDGKAHGILEGHMQKFDWLAHNIFRILKTEGDITESVCPTCEGKKRVRDVEATMKRVEDIEGSGYGGDCFGFDITVWKDCPDCKEKK